MRKPIRTLDGDEKVPGLEKAFGDVLRKYRRAAGLSQDKLALRGGFDRTFVSLLERGLRRPSLTTIFVLAVHLGVTPSAFVQDVEQRLSRLG